MASRPIRIGLTMGDPAGIGPEILLKALRSKKLPSNVRYVIFGDLNHLCRIAKRIQIPWAVPTKTSNIQIIDFKNVPKSLPLGIASANGGRSAGQFIEIAISKALSKEIDAIVTNPINKISLQKNIFGKKFIGHTELLSKLTKSKTTAMMMTIGHFRTVQVTSHIPFKEICRNLSKSRIFDVIRLTDIYLRHLGISRPRIGVAGLNPHAGEKGLFGNEETVFIIPAIKRAQKNKIQATGPYSPDIIWPLLRDKKLDAGIAMYHDQSQIPMKLLATSFGSSKTARFSGVNVTLGLPIIRTSVAHGTAYDIVGKGLASPESLIEATKLAIQMVKNRK